MTENSDDLKYYFFSDDHEYVSETFDDMDKVIVSGQCAVNEMFLMSNAKYNVIANSTFSFWAAALNANKKGVVAPKYFLKVRNGYKEFKVPETWKKVDNVDVRF